MAEDDTFIGQDESVTEARVRIIAKAMSEGTWKSSMKEYEKLGKEWGCTKSRIRQYAAEAHRYLSWDPEDRKGLRHSLATRMYAIAEDALARPNAKTGLPDYNSAITALNDFAKYAGIKADDDAHQDDVSNLSKAELESRIKVLFGLK